MMPCSDSRLAAVRKHARRVDVFIRADASCDIGAGHVMRCISLAEALRDSGCNVAFISRELRGNLFSEIKGRGFRLIGLPSAKGCPTAAGRAAYSNWLCVTGQRDARETREAIAKASAKADWLIVDHYGLDIRWEEAARRGVARLMVIDDLADRHHVCDLLLDQDDTLGKRSRRYDGLLPVKCLRLLGPAHALLRKEFTFARKRCRPRDGVIRRVLVTMGGVDRTNETGKAITALIEKGRQDIKVDVVVGKDNPNRNIVRRLLSGRKQFCFHCQVDNMAELMSQADLAISACGMTAWERCCLGLPGILVALSPNQEPVADYLGQRRIALNLSPAGRSKRGDYRTAIEYLMRNPSVCRNQSIRAMRLVDGSGAPRVADAILRLSATRTTI